jgi:hypothetical protein
MVWQILLVIAENRADDCCGGSGAYILNSKPKGVNSDAWEHSRTKRSGPACAGTCAGTVVALAASRTVTMAPEQQRAIASLDTARRVLVRPNWRQNALKRTSDPR